MAEQITENKTNFVNFDKMHGRYERDDGTTNVDSELLHHLNKHSPVLDVDLSTKKATSKVLEFKDPDTYPRFDKKTIHQSSTNDERVIDLNPNYNQVKEIVNISAVDMKKMLGRFDRS